MINKQSPKVMRYTATMADFDAQHSDRICKHYAHAREKHPYFCDRLTCLSESGADTHLEVWRATLEAGRHVGDVEAVDVIQCELYEAVQAYTHGNADDAVEELYDCIAAILRAIDVLEGRQELGKPKEEGGEK